MKQKKRELTLVEKIGQMVLLKLNGSELTGDIIELIQTYKVGGVILTKGCFKSVEELQYLINSLKALNTGNVAPLFIAMSHEIGRGNELPKDIRRMPAEKYLIENGNTDTFKMAHNVTADILKKIGVNMNFAPLLDMGGMVCGVPLGDRILSTNDPMAVSEYGSYIMDEYKNKGIIPVPKYFPSHTSTKADRGNITIPYTKKPLVKMEEFELVPFKKVIEAGAETMLVGNIHMARLNYFTPATMSNRVVTKLLRNRYNFDGIAIADDICSTCIKVQYGAKDAAKKAILAGNDMYIMSDAHKACTVLGELEKLVVRGKIDESRIDSSVQKILDIKTKYKLNDNEVPTFDLERMNKKIDKLIKEIK